MRLIKREGERAGNASAITSSANAAQPQTAHANTASIAHAIAQQNAPQSPQSCARPAAGEQRSEQRRSDNAPRSEVSAERRQDKPQPKRFIDGIDAELYQKLLNELGLPARRTKRVDVDLARRMHMAGWSYGQIAKHFKVSSCTVRRRLEKERGRS